MMKKLYIFFLLSLLSTKYCTANLQESFNKGWCNFIFHKIVWFFTNAKKEKLEEYSIINALYREKQITLEEYKKRLKEVDDAFESFDEWKKYNCSQHSDASELRKKHLECCDDMIESYRVQIRRGNFKEK